MDSMKRNIAIIGLGPHAKRIYLHYIKKYNENLSLVVELESERNNARKYLDENGFENTELFCVSDKYKDNYLLPDVISSNLVAVMKTMEITHIMISTEPKAHNMYLNFALKNDINVLTDKPITVTKNMTSTKSINTIKNQYYNILKLAESSSSHCKVMCQRQYHRGYEYIKKLLNETVKKYQIPITHIDIYHCDGNWEMMHDLDKENHPYKYGYGKLFHSGYHFIDLLSDLIKINNQLPNNKRIKYGNVYSDFFTPNDEKAVFNIYDYKRLFKNQDIPEYYKNSSDPNFNNYGEKNYYGLMKFTNSNHQLITEVGMNLLHYGFSRRGWIESKDFYKSNGRIRHERININVGPLMNIQIHSYQAKEIKDRLDCQTEEQVGGLEHFEIFIYRNVDLIGGEPFTKICLGDLYDEKEKKNILGYNELSREHYIKKFLNNKCDRGDIKDQALGIEILYACAKGLHNYYNHKSKVENIVVRNDYIYPNKIEELKRYSQINTKNLEKRLVQMPITIIPNIKEDDSKYINSNEEYIKNNLNKFISGVKNSDYEYHIMINHLIKSNSYEVYMSVSRDNDIASGLFYKEIKNIILAKFYVKILLIMAKRLNIKRLIKRLEYKNKTNDK